jgi:aminoglycoside phosphotransferase (APT) family kinase protein
MWALPADDLRSAEDVRTIMSGWAQIAADPSAFVRLGIASPRWVRSCVQVLRDAADAASYRGTAFLHMDVRSDNVCLQGERVVLVDWNWAVRGPAELDLACWLPSLRLEGGPPPEQVSPGLGGYAAAVASYLATAAAQPPVPDSPRLRHGQLDQLKIALPWACRDLGLPEPDRLPQ